MSNPAADPSAESSAEIEVPAEIRRSSAASPHTTGCLLAAIFVTAPALAYFGFFALLLLDDLVLETHYASDKLPPAVLEWIVIVYLPLIYLTQWALDIK